MQTDTTLGWRHAAVRDAACNALRAYAEHPWSGVAGTDYPADAGPAVLAALVAGPTQPKENEPAGRALATWLHCIRAGITHSGLFSWGLAGCFVGAQFGSSGWPGLSGLAASFRSVLLERVAMRPWRLNEVGWRDYDLITGPSGIMLALSIDPACSQDQVLPLTRHLTVLCDADDLRRLRVGAYRGERLRGWNYGRINTGLAHGVTGVVAALRARAEIAGLDDQIALALQRITRWLVAQSFTDDRGVLTWANIDLDDSPRLPQASRRQAWCYGNPGVAWTLWEAGRVLGDTNVQSFALTCANSFLTAYDDAYYLDGFSICHGAAGLLLIADAFARHADLCAAARLRDHLERYILEHLDEAVKSVVADPSLLSGASGVLAALLSLHTGDVRWLPVIGLR